MERTPQTEPHLADISSLRQLAGTVLNFVRNGGYDPVREEYATVEIVEKYGLNAVALVDEGESWETYQSVRSRWGE